MWRNKHPTERSYLDANKLATVRRDIEKNQRLSNDELKEIEEQVRQDLQIPEIEEPAAISENTEPEPGTPAVLENVDENNNSIEETYLEDDEVISEMKDYILRKWEVLKEEDMAERPVLPKIKNDKKSKRLIQRANRAIELIKLSNAGFSLTELNQLIYAAAFIITEELGIKPRKTTTNRKRKPPAWKMKIEKDIEMKRKELSILTELEKDSRVKERKIRNIERKYNIRRNQNLTEVKEIIKQQMQAKAQRIRRFEKRTKFYRQNKTFKEDTKRFYCELGKKSIEVKEPPEICEVEEFWSKIWEDNKSHNSEAQWIKDQEKVTENQEQQRWHDISKEEAILAIMKSSNWKAPGNDGIAKFWLKNLSSVHEDLTTAYNDTLKNPEKQPDWLTEGLTYLLPKTEETKNPKNYRPINCLPTMYKILTSILTERTYAFLEENELLPTEQKGCKRGSYGCKDQLLINKMILENCARSKRNLSSAWIDYKKVFDSVPHSWIIKCLEMFKINPTVVNFISASMKKWKTTLHLNHNNGSLNSRRININSGIFQGDSLSPLLFYLALAPLSRLLNNTKQGYEINKRKINHLFYMDDLKAYAMNDNQLMNLLDIVNTFSDDIKMEFGLDKCAKATFIKGKLTKTSNIVLNQTTTIQELDQEGTYKYLGINEGDGIQHSKMKEKIRKEYYRRIRMVLKSELNAMNKIEAINTVAIPVVTYSFNIINWTLEDIRNLDRKTRKLLTKERMHHPKSDVDRMYLPRSTGGRGLIQIETTYKTTTIGLAKYVEKSQDLFLKLVNLHEEKKKSYSIMSYATKFKQELNLNEIEEKNNESVTKLAKRVKQHAKSKALDRIKKKWESKAMHGQYPSRIKEADVDFKQTNDWLKGTGLKAETEGLIIAAQDQSLATRLYHHRIIKDGTNPLCRLCNKYDESIDHILAGCPELAKTEYIKRHNNAAAYMHWKILQYYNIKTADKWYEHQPETVTENETVTILWDMQVHTDRTIKANKPDISIKNKKEKTCILIDLAVPSDRNTSVKVAEKLSKYKDLEIEITRMWGMKTQIVPVIIGALGVIKKGIDKEICKIPGNINVTELQKITLLGSAHILRKVLSIK